MILEAVLLCAFGIAAWIHGRWIGRLQAQQEELHHADLLMIICLRELCQEGRMDQETADRFIQAWSGHRRQEMEERY